MKISFSGMEVVITGGSSGIGLALAQQLAAAGARLTLLARDETKLQAARSTLEGAGHQIFSLDVSQRAAVLAFANRYEAERGAPDMLINAAGITYPGYVEDLPLDIFESMMAVNYFGTVYITKAFLPGMIARGSGRIVNIASAAGFVGVFGYAAYGASKYAVRGFSDVLRAEMKPKGVQVSIVFPPDTDTPQLAFEDPLKPPETRALAGNASLLTAAQVAQATLRGVARGQYVILPGFENKVIYRVVNLLGNGVYPLMDWLIADAQKKIRRDKDTARE